MGVLGITHLLDFATNSGAGKIQDLALNTLAYQPRIQGKREEKKQNNVACHLILL